MSYAHLNERARFTFSRAYVLNIGLLFILATFAYAFLLYSEPMNKYWSTTNVVLFYATGASFAIGLVGAVATNRTALTSSMFFCYMFFFVAVREQVLYAWDRVLIADQRIIQNALLLVLTFGLIILLVNSIPLRVSAARQKSHSVVRDSYTVAIMLAVCLVVEVVFVVYFGSSLIGSRADKGQVLASLADGAVAETGLTHRAFRGVFGGFIFPFLYLFPLLTIINLWRSRNWLVWSLAIAALLLGILLNNPTIHGRFYVGTLIVGTAMLITGPHHASRALSILILGTLISPALHVFRRAWNQDDLSFKVLDLSGLRSLDFDAFSMICHGLVYHGERGILFGANVVSSLFFFIPRSIWRGKAGPTGELLFETVILRFRDNTDLQYASNLAAPIPIEGFLALGWPGLVALSLAFGTAVRWLDGAPRLNGLRERSLSIRVAWLAYSPVLLLYVARGALLPTSAYAVGLFSAIFLAVRLLRASERTRPQR